MVQVRQSAQQKQYEILEDAKVQELASEHLNGLVMENEGFVSCLNALYILANVLKLCLDIQKWKLKW